MASAKSISNALFDEICNEIKQWATSNNTCLSFLDFHKKLGPLMQQYEYAGISTMILTNTVTLTSDLLVKLGLMDSTTSAIHAKQKIVQLLEEQPPLAHHVIENTEKLPFFIVTDTATFQALLHRIGTVQAIDVLRQFSTYHGMTQALYHKYLQKFDFAHGLLPGASCSSNGFALHQTTTELLDMVLKIKAELYEQRMIIEQEHKAQEHEREMAATERFTNMQRWEVLKHLPGWPASIREAAAAPLDLSTNAPAAACQASKKSNDCSIGLFATPTPGDWYVMCRQEVGWQKAKRTLLERNVQECYKWEKVITSKRDLTVLFAHNICSDKWLWLSRDNILRYTGTPLPTDEAIIDMITPLLYDDKSSPIDYVIPKLEG